jgi:DNA-binding response OmpR family regulator
MSMEERSLILIVDDDPDIRKVLYMLLRDDYAVAEAADGTEAVRYIGQHPETDLVVLDVMMPGLDGFETCDRIRAFSNVPILFLTAKSAEADRISAYGSGGDDFLSKPFSQAELMAKISSLLRRYKQYRGKPASVLTVENLEVDFAARSVKSNGKPVVLTDTEYAILEYLLQKRGSIVTAAELYEAVWGAKFLAGSGNTVMVHVLNVRRKIEEDPSKPKILRTVWGRGYQID